MRFGLYINPQTPGPEDDGRIIREVLGQIEFAESLGFEDVWLTEHHFTGYNAYSDPVTLAAAIAKATTRMTIGYSLAVVPFHHPIRFVTACNLIDQISEGRLFVGVGPGNSPDEFNGYGLSADDRHAMTNEFVEICEQAWHAPVSGFSYSGKYWHGDVRGRIIPSPYQRPRPPIAWATTTTDTIEWAGTKGYSWLVAPFAPEWVAPRMKRYIAGLEQANLDDAALERAWYGTGMNRQLYVLEPGEDWRETIGEYVDVYVRESARANFGIDNLPKADMDARRDRLLRTWLFVGTAEELVERLRPYAEIGVRHCMVWSTFGYLPDELVRGSLHRLARDVIPHLRDITPDPAALERYAELAPV
jgi:alkanesulfonate monooxygenase SsuD/methylene tetrahydromethanopterin reductase-like flavin-dependent oxidoreductase (luciferase family)